MFRSTSHRFGSLSTPGQQEELMFSSTFQLSRAGGLAPHASKGNQTAKRNRSRLVVLVVVCMVVPFKYGNCYFFTCCRLLNKTDSFGEFQRGVSISKIANLFPCFSSSHRIHVWYIYANIGGILMVNVTIYNAYMDPMGIGLAICHQ